MTRRLVTAVLAVLVLAGCDSAADHPRDAQGTLTVFAAASLTDVFTQLGQTLETQRPGLHVRFTFAGSSALAAQIDEGAPADVFASADGAQMARVAKLAQGTPLTFASNVLEIAVPKGNPGHVTGLAAFARNELTVAVCAPEVPCGRPHDGCSPPPV